VLLAVRAQPASYDYRHPGTGDERGLK
jgi:hypothetical protein